MNLIARFLPTKYVVEPYRLIRAVPDEAAVDTPRRERLESAKDFSGRVFLISSDFQSGQKLCRLQVFAHLGKRTGPIGAIHRPLRAMEGHPRS
jgi:hypothetical protein